MDANLHGYVNLHGYENGISSLIPKTYPKTYLTKDNNQTSETAAKGETDATSP